MEAALAVLASLREGKPPLTYADIRPLLMIGGKEIPQIRRVGPDRVKKDLKKIEEQAGALKSTLVNLHPSTAALFRNLDRIRRDLHILEVVAQFAEAPEQPVLPERTTPPQRLAFAAAMVFVRTTGEMPTRRYREGKKSYGPFYAFLTAVFEARGVNRASVENSAKWAISRLSGAGKSETLDETV